MARVLLGVSGGIAAYKAVEFVRLATGAGHSVRVLMSPTARRFVGPETFEGILGAPVLVSEFEHDPLKGTFPGDPLPEHDPIGHLALAEAADAYLIAPASANTVAKLAAGLADSMLTTSFLACRSPRLIAPAMNDRMYSDPATQANLARLRDRGADVIEPGEGRLASRGEAGVGRLPEPAELMSRLEAALAGADTWRGLKVLVTAGGSREPIDPVRFIGNRSSGRMGMALAAEARARGAEVTVVAANVDLPAPSGSRRIDVTTTSELAAATAGEFPGCDVLLMAAAPADFRPVAASESKLSREAGGIRVELEPTEDILAGLGAARRDGQTVVGFAAEHGGDGVGRAREKLERKGADMIVLNDVSREEIGFESDRNAVTLVEPDGAGEVPIATKREVAAAILDRIESRRRLLGA